MKRSSRSTPTGPGSRGGHWHDPNFRAEYWRGWRRTHPDYREREATRSAARKAIRREALAVAMPTFTESLVALLRQEIEGTYKPPKLRTYSKQRLIARHLLLSSEGVSKLVNEWRSPRADTIDALIDYFGFDRCIANYRRMRKEARLAVIARLSDGSGAP